MTLKLQERLRVAEAVGLEVTIKLSPEEAGSLALLMETLDIDSLRVRQANRKAADAYRDKIFDRVMWSFYCFVAVWAAWAPIATAIEVLTQQR